MRTTNTTHHRPTVETLEGRCVPATVTFANGTLTVTGNNAAEKVVILQADSQDQLIINYDLTLPNGTTFALSQTFKSSDVKQIKFDLKGGDDSVTYILLSDFLFSKDIKGDLGLGGDTFFFASAPGYLTPSPADMKADLVIHLVTGPEVGDGNDTVNIAVGEVDGVRVFVQADLGAGDDRFTFRLNGDQKGAANIQSYAFGGDGADELRVFAGYLWTSPKTHQLEKVPSNQDAAAFMDVYLDGGKGDDLLGLYYYGEIDGTLTHHLHGGDGVDIVLPMIAAKAGSTGTVLAY